MKKTKAIVAAGLMCIASLISLVSCNGNDDHVRFGANLTFSITDGDLRNSTGAYCVKSDGSREGTTTDGKIVEFYKNGNGDWRYTYR